MRDKRSLTNGNNGRISDKKVVDQQTADVLFIAWRCLYAAITKSRMEQKQINPRTRLTNDAYKY